MGPSSLDPQAMIGTTPNLASTLLLERANQPIDNMANPMSMVTHNVFHGLGEDHDVHINRFNTMAQANNQAADADKLRVFPTTLHGYASDWYAQFPVGHFTTWDDLCTAFLDSFHPIGYVERVRDELSNVQLLRHETLQMYPMR